MNKTQQILRSIALLITVLGAIQVSAQDWPQWRGPARDAKVSGFTAPATWPTTLNQKWKAKVGQGDSTPALVGDKLYVFARGAGREVLLCLDANSGKELWQQGYDALPSDGPAGRHPGPRSSPAVADGKVITFGVRGALSCFDATTGKLLWRKDESPGAWPRFFTACSPLVDQGLCIVEQGGDANGGIVAYDLNSGEQKWKWSGDGAAFSSPVTVVVGGTKAAVTLTAKKIVALAQTDGKLLWESPFAPQGRSYCAATPIVLAQTVIYTGAGHGTKAVSLAKDGDGFVATDLWSNTNSVQFNTPVLRNDLIFGFAANGNLFCIDEQKGNTLWAAPAPGGRSGFGSIVDAGSVLIALTPQSELMVLAPSNQQFEKLASYKVAESETYTYPVLAKNAVYVKDQDSVTLWGFE